jgi:hypothetical protein
LDQALPVGRGSRIFALHRSDLGDFYMLGVRDVNLEAPTSLADGTDDLRQYFRYYQAAEVTGTESFEEEKAGLDGAETEADISAFSRQSHASVLTSLQLFGQSSHGRDARATAARLNARALAINPSEAVKKSICSGGVPTAALKFQALRR